MLNESNLHHCHTADLQGKSKAVATKQEVSCEERVEERAKNLSLRVGGGMLDAALLLPEPLFATSGV